MTVLHVIVDELISGSSDDTAQYTEHLTRALIEHAPTSCSVEGIVAASSAEDYDRITASLPGLADLFKSALSRRELAAAWQHGFTPVPSGMVHAPSLLAPLRKHDRLNTRNQIVVTIKDVTAWTHPQTLPARQVSWTKAMAERAYKYADAIVVPTHAMADELQEILDFGERIRVIGGGISGTTAPPLDAEARVNRMALPERYLLTTLRAGDSESLTALLAALALPASPSIPLFVVGTEDESGEIAAAAAKAGLPLGRVNGLGDLGDDDRSVVLSRATAFVVPMNTDGFGMSMLEAFHFGTPVVRPDSPSLVEIAGDAGLPVASGDTAAYPRKLADAISELVGDDSLRSRLGLLGSDRAGMFSWQTAAEKVWQLHADL